MHIPHKQIRALYNDNTIRVYQAYSDIIVDSALEHGTFISPPFKMDRMTWIKPSFLWMMYRSGWGKKDSGQNRILAIDITREGFEWALEHSCLSHFDKAVYATEEEWKNAKNTSPVRIQWDPERDMHFKALEHRAIQIGLSGVAVKYYVNDWIHTITDITEIATEIYSLVKLNQLDKTRALLPRETSYPIKASIARKICLTS